MNSFLKEIKYFLCNPLGIIGLFLTTVYLIAAILLNNGLDKLHGDLERQPLIWFVIVFPFVILFVFYILVTKHFDKIYGPSDFKTDSAFLKYKNENVTLASDKEVEDNNKKKLMEEGNSFSLMAYSETVNNSEQSKIQDILITELKVLIKLNKLYDVQFYQNIKITSDSGVLIPDGYGTKNGKQYIVEVKIFKSGVKNIIKNTVDNYINKAQLILNDNISLKYIFAFVLEGISKQYNEEIKDVKHSHSQNIDIIIFDKNCNIISYKGK